MMEHDLSAMKPDYDGGGLVNLMCSLGDALGAPPTDYPLLRGLPRERLRDARRIVLLLIDGLGSALLDHLGPQSALRALRSGTMTSVYPPTTATAITTIMTGLAPQQHGLTGWFMHFRKLGAVTAILPFMPRYGRAPPLSGAGVPLASVIDCPSFFDRISVPSAALLPQAIVDSDFSQLVGHGAERVPYTDVADFAARLAAFCRGEHDARYVYAYWSELDHLSHLHGPSSDIVARHFRELDAALAPVIDTCAQHGTLLIATADHGFIDSGAAERIDVEDHGAMADMLSLPLCGEPRSAYCYVRLRAAAAFEEYVRSTLAPYAELQSSAQLIDDGWFGRGAAHPELAARIGDYTLQMRGRYTLRDRVAGERDMRLEGVHGGVSAAEQVVPLLLAGC